jgi:KAP family P-loop domain
MVGMAEAPNTGLSPSVQAAMDWAAAVARVRERTPVGERDPVASPMDLLVGAMLSHTDEDGEVRVLLSHFGLTARDVVGEEYARVTPASLAAAGPHVARGQVVPDGPAGSIVAWAQQHSGGDAQLLHLVGGMLSAQTELTTRFESAFASIGETRQAVASSYEGWLSTRPQSGQIAGRSLREWLQENNPRAPVSVAGFSTDDVASPELQQQDLVGVSPEANALAYLVASRDLVPPLAVGLFGDWGSGKSFLMRDVRSRIRSLVALSAEQPQHDSAIWKNIRHIEFNAWEYVQGDLWAGLLEKIFQTLGTKVQSPNLVKARREPISLQLDEQRAVVEKAAAAQHELTKQVEAAQAEVCRATELLQARVQAVGDLEGRVPEEAKVAASKVLRELWSEQRVAALGDDADRFLDALGEAWKEVQQGRALLGLYWRDWRRIALVTAAVLVVPLVTWLIQTFTTVGGVTSALAGLAAGVPVLTAWLGQFARWSQEQREAIEEATRQVRATHLEPVLEAERTLAEAETRQAEVTKALADQTATVDEEKKRAQDLEDELTTLTPGRVFAEFADKRSTDYRSQLGFLGTVRADLRTIEGELAKNNRAAGRAADEDVPYDEQLPNRIVLYVDDLDRCPPAKVLQVLEAVHLLLAFPLFVVFVAVDSRWLSSALIEQLHALRVVRPGGWTASTDTPTARDYLEKIFQLPFWVQPLSGSDRGSIVAGLLAPTVRADATTAGSGGPGGLEVSSERSVALETMLAHTGSGLRLETNSLALTPTELEFIVSLGPLLGDTPRRVKRFVNTVQFLLSIRPPLSDQGPRSPRMATALLAAIHEGLPSIARQVFKESSSVEPLEVALDAAGVAGDERDALVKWLDEPGRVHWRQVTPSEIGERREMVQRLGFGRPVR